MLLSFRFVKEKSFFLGIHLILIYFLYHPTQFSVVHYFTKVNNDWGALPIHIDICYTQIKEKFLHIAYLKKKSLYLLRQQFFIFFGIIADRKWGKLPNTRDQRSASKINGNVRNSGAETHGPRRNSRFRWMGKIGSWITRNLFTTPAWTSSTKQPIFPLPESSKLISFSFAYINQITKVILKSLFDCVCSRSLICYDSRITLFLYLVTYITYRQHLNIVLAVMRRLRNVL